MFAVLSIFEIKKDHGCQLIVNGLLPTLKYYLRLISNPKTFFNTYIKLVENDKELKIAKHGRKQMEAFCEYYEALCLGSQSRITVDMFRLINTYLWFKK